MPGSRRGLQTAQHVIALMLIGGVVLAACAERNSSPTTLLPTARPSETESATESVPTDLPDVPIAASTLVPAATAFAFTSDFTSYTVTGTIYDSELGTTKGLAQARVEWHFADARLRAFDGIAEASSDGTYRMPIRVRAQDEITVMATAPGYLPSTVRLHGGELALYGSRLDFGLVNISSALPTVPGDLGSIQVNGRVYDAAKGTRAVIGGAMVTLTYISVVRPDSQLVLTTDISGTFSTALEMHVTDQIEIDVSASGYLTATLIRRAKELINAVPITIGLKPKPE